jgi:hypothetical protein
MTTLVDTASTLLAYVLVRLVSKKTAKNGKVKMLVYWTVFFYGCVVLVMDALFVLTDLVRGMPFGVEQVPGLVLEPLIYALFLPPWSLIFTGTWLLGVVALVCTYKEPTSC